MRERGAVEFTRRGLTRVHVTFFGVLCAGVVRDGTGGLEEYGVSKEGVRR